MDRTIRWCAAVALAIATAACLVGAALAQAPETTQPASSDITPRKAMALSLIPGLGQHYLGEHKKALLIEGVSAAGLVVLLASGNSSSSDGPGSGSYTPPPSPSRMLAPRIGAGGGGDGSGNGDGQGSSAGKIIGATLLLGGVAWSLIDAPISARRRIEAHATDPAAPAPHTSLDQGPHFRVAVVPWLDGFRARVALSF